MDNSLNISLQIKGEGLLPASLPISELAYILKAYSATLRSIVAVQHPELRTDRETVLLNLQGIEEGSAVLAFGSSFLILSILTAIRLLL